MPTGDKSCSSSEMKFTVSANLCKISGISVELQQIKTKVRFSYHYPIIPLQQSCTWIHTAHSCHGWTDNNRKAKKKQTEGNAKKPIPCACVPLIYLHELVAYHDSYVKAMEKYGLQRDVRGSEARQTSELEINMRNSYRLSSNKQNNGWTK